MGGTGAEGVWPPSAPLLAAVGGGWRRLSFHSRACAVPRPPLRGQRAEGQRPETLQGRGGGRGGAGRGREAGWGRLGAPLPRLGPQGRPFRNVKKRRSLTDGGSARLGAGRQAGGGSHPPRRLPGSPTARSWGAPPRAPRPGLCPPRCPPGGLLSGLDGSACLLIPPTMASLLLTALLQDCHRSEMVQPRWLSGPKGGAVNIPFSFCHRFELAENPDVRVSWRLDTFHGPFFFNQTPPFTRKDYRGRVQLTWQSESSGYLQIRDLRKEDATKYFCRVQLVTKQRVEQWQAIEGTQLTVAPALGTTTKTTAATATTTTAGFGVSESGKIAASRPLSLGAAAGVALAGLGLITVILGLMVFLRQKRREGPQTKGQTPARGSFQDTEEKYENIGNKGQHTPPELDHKEDGIVYASLALSSLSSLEAPPCGPAQRSPEADTLYSAVKA